MIKHTYYFLRWVLAQMWKRRPKFTNYIATWWESQVHYMGLNPWFTTIVWVGMGLLSMLVYGFFFNMFTPDAKNTPVIALDGAWTIFIPAIICFFQWLAIGITALHRAYTAEQERLIKILKD